MVLYEFQVNKRSGEFGGTVKGLVPDNVNQKLMEKFNIKNNSRGSLCDYRQEQRKLIHRKL